MSEQTVGTLHAHNEHQAVCPHCDFANRELVRLQGELEEARREYEGPMAGEIQRLQGEKAALEAQDEVHWKTRRALLKEKEALERELAEARQQNWYETAMQESRNRNYYRGLVVKIGELFSTAARTADDGGVSEDVLCAKVPDLVEQALAEAHAAIREAAIDHDWMGGGKSGCSPACGGCAWEQKHAPTIRRATGGT